MHTRLATFTLLGLLLPILGGESAPTTRQVEADRFLELVNSVYRGLYRIEEGAHWNSLSDVRPEHEASFATAGKARAAFAGSEVVIREARRLLEHTNELSAVSIRQLNRVLFNAAEGPMTNPELVAERIETESTQASVLNGYVFRLHGRDVTANDLDNLLGSSTNLQERLAAWEASKAIGPVLKPGLVKLQSLRNRVARELGYHDYFALQVAAYGMTAEEMVRLQDAFMAEVRPLYLQLHTWAKHELARRYHQPVPRLIPAHWLNNRWSQEWPGLVPAVNLDERLAGRTPEWIVRTAESFYTSLGFGPLPESFWTKSDLYPLPAGGPRRKNAHASCWHLDLERDVRSLMSVEPNWQWLDTAHHELGHAYYFLAYARPEVPPLLRIGANPAFHEAVGELASLACSQVPYLQTIGVLPAEFVADPTAFLLDNALERTVPFMFWASGTMTHWEADFYAGDLTPDQWNRRWWDYVRRYQGVEPPSPRDEAWCDPATKTHINDNPAYYYSYAIATVLKYQLHDHIARRILHQPPQACNYAGNKAVGEFLVGLLRLGATEDWRTVLRQATGEDLSTRALREYFQPLMTWLEHQNQGRTIGFE